MASPRGSRVTVKFGGEQRTAYFENGGGTVADALRKVAITEVSVVVRNEEAVAMTDAVRDGDILIAAPPSKPLS